MLNNSIKRALFATALTSAMAIAGSAQALEQLITWNPGSGSAAITGSPPSGSLPYTGGDVLTDRITYVAVQDTLSSEGACDSPSQQSCWFMSFDGDGRLTESFQFLTTVAANSGDISQSRRFGNDNLIDPLTPGPYTQTYVSVQATLEGQLAGGSAGVAAILAAGSNTANIASAINVVYDLGGTFDYSFHNDLNAGTPGTDIGRFTVSGSSTAGAVQTSRLSLNWLTTLTDEGDVTGVWADEDGLAFNPLEDLVNSFTQTVEVVDAQANGDGVLVRIFSRGAETGFSVFPKEVPEPAVLGLLGIGLLGIGVVARRRRTTIEK